MEVITIESQAFNEMMLSIERKIVDTVTKHVSQNDPWMSVKQVAAYTGFSEQWVKLKSVDIGVFQDGKGLRFKKSNIEAYMQKHSVKRK